MITANSIEQAYQRIQPDIIKTPLVYSQELSKISGANVYLKMEHLQQTGSFKIRGVLNKLSDLDTEAYQKTFVASSTGNHAAAFCFAAEKFGFQGVLFLPKNITDAKLNAITSPKVKKVLFGNNSVEAEHKATMYAKEIDGILVHPYNDLKIIEGQGTLGAEIATQLPNIDVVLAPVGGGGLISGLSIYFAEKNTSVIGCQPENASEMYESIIKNEIVPPSELKTVADAAAGGVEKDAATFHICKQYLNGFEILTEEAIKKAVALLMKHHQIIVEATAALPVAALLNSSNYKDKNVVLVLTGKKIDKNLFKEIQNTYDYCN
ncbi:pyridoxal-phosphate dependent enzyme [Tenacibaculum amylolyticum]|uniref:pyridoxal-phosphate dependent enzyme n=1 Tax=Tenacibaculum amylolyticum TaxID=104269 RepID=UPI0038953086